MQVSATVCSICRRAAYAVSSSGLMWARYLAAAERAGASAEEVADIYDRAMSTKLKVNACHPPSALLFPLTQLHWDRWNV
jgi:hypothetical protein